LADVVFMGLSSSPLQYPSLHAEFCLSLDRAGTCTKALALAGHVIFLACALWRGASGWLYDAVVLADSSAASSLS